MWECEEEIEEQLKEITNIKKKLQLLKHTAIDNEQATMGLGYGYLAFLSLISRIEISLSWWEEELNKKLEGKDNIIKEARELVNKEDFTMKQKYEMRESILEILDKVEENK